MATAVGVCGFECGVLLGGGTAATGHFRDANAGGTAPGFSTTTVRSGLRALRCNPSASFSAAVFCASDANETRFIGRVYIQFATLPSADCALVTHGATVGPNGPSVRFKQSDSKIYAAVGTTFGASGVAVITGQWYRVDFDFNISTAGNDTCDIQIDGTACGQATAAGLGSGSGSITLGAINTCTADVFFDDFILSITPADYPLGAGYVLSYIPNADGAHNVAGAADFKKGTNATPAGVDITNATTDAYQWIDERPLPTTSVDFINGIAPPNATDYVEWQYEDSDEPAAPRAVEAVIVYHGASAASNNWTVTLRDSNGGTSANVFSGAETAPTSVTIKRACFATIPGGGAWTGLAFDALRSRFLVSDAAPDPYIDAAMLEAEFIPALPPGLFRDPGGAPVVNQMSQLLVQ